MKDIYVDVNVMQEGEMQGQRAMPLFVIYQQQTYYQNLDMFEFRLLRFWACYAA
jgi:hypothetical protein